MVYCGKSSNGCSNCRERKIRREPGCGQCGKRQQKCPGNRNLVDLMFRDESSHVISKANTQPKKKVNTSPAKTTASSTGQGARPRALTCKWSSESSVESSLRRQPGKPSTSTSVTLSSPKAPNKHSQCIFTVSEHIRQVTENLEQKPETWSSAAVTAPQQPYFTPSFEDRGLNVFITRYITVYDLYGTIYHNIPANDVSTNLSSIWDIWKPSNSAVDQAGDPVLASIAAVGLLGVAQMTKARIPLEEARKNYGQALRLINNALRDPAEALKDTTMLSVLVLGLYETVADPSHRTMRAWQQHVEGAAALARMRGMSQFRSKASIRMLMMLCQNTMINCIQNDLPMPRDLIDLRKQLLAWIGADQPRLEICNTMYKILQLRYDIKQGILSDLDKMPKTFNEAEDDFERAASNFPQEWQYRRYCLIQHFRPGFFNEICHVYPAIWVATIWNGLRTCRMLILETMLEELHQRFLRVPVEVVPRRYQIKCRMARLKMERIALAILASIPQHFGLIGPTDDNLDTFASMPSVEDFRHQDCEEDWEPWLGESDISDSSSSDHDKYKCRSPSLSNPMQVRGAEAQAERFMTLASVTNGLVWPLYLVGMPTASSVAMKAFVIERLHAIHAETGLAQARTVADVVTSHMHTTELSEQRSKPFGSVNVSKWNSQCV